MTAWLDRWERILLHEKFIQRRLLLHQVASLSQHPRLPPLVYPRDIRMALQPSAFGVTLENIVDMYGASDFVGALSHFIVHLQQPAYSRAEVEHAAACLHLPLTKVSAFHQIKFVTQDPFSLHPSANSVIDAIYCEPARCDTYGNIVPGRFDTAIINLGGGRVGVKAMS